ncbi:MAG: LysE family transporter [Alphaproteobacteria bacterium]|nr:LysE family transporter [Alphaproteobacteria bacterium]
MVFEAILNGFILGFIFCISVGPIFFTIIKKSLEEKVNRAFFFVLGVSVSDIILVILVNSFSSFFLEILKYKKIIALVGSIFFIIYGIYLFMAKVSFNKTIQDQDLNTERHSFKQNFISGFMMNILNPGIYFFWFAWGTTIHLQASEYKLKSLYLIIVFVTCLLMNFLLDVTKVFYANKLRVYLNETNLKRFHRTTAVIFIVAGIAIFLRYYERG